MARADFQRRSSTSTNGETGEQWVLAGRDQSAFHHAETHMLVQETQMLRHEVRGLEKKIAETNPVSPTITHEPYRRSHLTQSTRP